MLNSLRSFRRRVGAFIGGFEAGLASRRLKGFQPSRAHLNTLIAAAGPDIVARARWLVRNNGYAANAIESWAGNVIGAGIKPSSQIKDAGQKVQIQTLWLDWTDDADAEGFTDFYGLQRRAAREVFIAGEVFFRFRPRRPQDGLTVPLQLQMLPSEMLPLRQALMKLLIFPRFFRRDTRLITRTGHRHTRRAQYPLHDARLDSPQGHDDCCCCACQAHPQAA